MNLREVQTEAHAISEENYMTTTNNPLVGYWQPPLGAGQSHQSTR